MTEISSTGNSLEALLRQKGKIRLTDEEVRRIISLAGALHDSSDESGTPLMNLDRVADISAQVGINSPSLVISAQTVLDEKAYNAEQAGLFADDLSQKVSALEQSLIMFARQFRVLAKETNRSHIVHSIQIDGSSNNVAYDLDFNKGGNYALDISVTTDPFYSSMFRLIVGPKFKENSVHYWADRITSFAKREMGNFPQYMVNLLIKNHTHPQADNWFTRDLREFYREVMEDRVNYLPYYKITGKHFKFALDNLPRIIADYFRAQDAKYRQLRTGL